ncbi:MAG: hypothetical protein AAF417_00910 [Pseudomonadota bacterium]
MFTRIRLLTLSCALLALSASPNGALAHGSVALEDDLCAIQIGYFKAHFKIFLPSSHQHDDFCEDLPAAGESIFVMEYVHSGLGAVPIDFRIIENVTGMGTFARWEHVQAIEDLEAVTVLYRPPEVVPDVFTIMHRFADTGEYIGIVTAATEHGDPYTAVFPFEVGFTGLGYWPLIVLIAIALQLNYWFMSGRFGRRDRRPVRPVEVSR